MIIKATDNTEYTTKNTSFTTNTIRTIALKLISFVLWYYPKYNKPLNTTDLHRGVCFGSNYNY